MATPAEDSLFLDVRVTPRGGRDAVIGWDGAARVLSVRVQAPPVEGAANRAVAELLAETLGLRPRQITLVAGGMNRRKRFCLFGITTDEWERWLAALPPA